MGLYKRSGSPHWWYEFQFRGERIRESAGTADRDDAEQVEARRKRALWEQDRLGVKPEHTWRAAVLAYLNTLPDTAGDKAKTKSRLRWLDQHLADKTLSAITRGLLLDIQRACPGAPGTVNRVMGTALAVLNYAVTREWIDHAPSVPKVKDPVKRTMFISREQAARLLSEVPPHLHPMVVFALETGLRRSNVTQLEWPEVDLERRVAWVYPDKAKQGKGIAVPLSPAAVECLTQQKAAVWGKGPHSGPVFTYKGRPVVQTATKAWHKACARAGLPAGFRWHDLRHTWASWHRQDGTPLHVLKELGGWSDSRMVERYAHLGADHLKQYVERHVGLGTKVPTEAVSKARRLRGKSLKTKAKGA